MTENCTLTQDPDGNFRPADRAKPGESLESFVSRTRPDYVMWNGQVLRIAGIRLNASARGNTKTVLTETISLF